MCRMYYTSCWYLGTGRCASESSRREMDTSNNLSPGAIKQLMTARRIFPSNIRTQGVLLTISRIHVRRQCDTKHCFIVKTLSLSRHLINSRTSHDSHTPNARVGSLITCGGNTLPFAERYLFSEPLGGSKSTRCIRYVKKR